MKVKKTKTKHIVEKITSDAYEMGPCQVAIKCTKQETTTLTIARFHMLECGTNLKGTMREVCNVCSVTDNENHRLNHCKKFKTTNRYLNREKINFDDIYSCDINVVKRAIKAIEQVWNTKSAHGTMHK